MSNAASGIVGLRDPEVIQAMKRAFDTTLAAVRAWGAFGPIFDEDEARAAISEQILVLAEQGVRGADALASRALTRIGAEALDRVAQSIRPVPRRSVERRTLNEALNLA